MSYHHDHFTLMELDGCGEGGLLVTLPGLPEIGSEPLKGYDGRILFTGS
jgi:hypothetical protein